MNKRENLVKATKVMQERASEIKEMDNKRLVRLIGTVKAWEELARQEKDCNDLWYTLQDVRVDVEREVLNRMK